MKQSTITVLLLVLSVSLTACKGLPEDPPETVAAVDLNRYAGLWYEIARLPVFFQKADELATARYTLNSEGTIDLVNTAIRPDGGQRSVTGTAVPVPGSGNARLKVTIDNFFAKLFGSPPDYGNYWVLKLDPEYRHALVGSADRRTLWLLARKPEIPPAVLREYLEHAARAGYATGEMILNNGEFPQP